jgi:hypothetical protein
MPFYGGGKPVQEKSKREIIAAMIVFTIIGLVVCVASIAVGGWWRVVGLAFTLFAIASALWIAIRELWRRSRA